MQAWQIGTRWDPAGIWAWGPVAYGAVSWHHREGWRQLAARQHPATWLWFSISFLCSLPSCFVRRTHSSPLRKMDPMWEIRKSHLTTAFRRIYTHIPRAGRRKGHGHPSDVAPPLAHAEAKLPSPGIPPPEAGSCCHFTFGRQVESQTTRDPQGDRSLPVCRVRDGLESYVSPPKPVQGTDRKPVWASWTKMGHEVHLTGRWQAEVTGDGRCSQEPEWAYPRLSRLAGLVGFIGEGLLRLASLRSMLFRGGPQARVFPSKQQWSVKGSASAASAILAPILS